MWHAPMDRKKGGESGLDLNTLMSSFKVAFKPEDRSFVKVVVSELIEKKIQVDHIKAS